MAILHICGARDIILLFFDHQDTESESFEIQMSIFQTIFTHKKTAEAIWDKDIPTLKIGEKYIGSYSYLCI